WFAYEDVTCDQAIENCRGECSILATIDGDKVGGRRNGCKAIFLGDCGNAVSPGYYFGYHVTQVSLILDGCNSCCLRKAVHCEMIANLVERFDSFGIADNITAANACQSVGFGEGAHPQNIWPAGFERREGGGRPGFAIGLIQNEHSGFRNLLDERLDIRTLMPGSHRIIWVGEIQDCSILLARRVKQSVEVRSVVDIGNGDQIS